MLVLVHGLEKPQKVFYECETLVKQVYSGQMWEQDVQVEGTVLPDLLSCCCCCSVVIRGSGLYFCLVGWLVFLGGRGS